MTKIAWVTDSTAFLDEELKNHPDVYQVPLTVVLDNQEFLDGVDLSSEELFSKLKRLKNPPSTSQPSVGAFKSQFEKLAKDYDVIFSILLSSKLSGTVSSSEQAAKMVDVEVITIDSKILSFPLTALLKKGIALFKEGLTIIEIKDRLESIRETSETYVLIGSLEQLHRSGRMSGLQFYLGSLLNVKPIISVENGVLKAKEKIRSEKKAKDKIVQYLLESYEKYRFNEVYLLYGLHQEMALSWKEELNEILPDVEFNCFPLGATIGVHAGENTLGISWYNGLNE